MPDVTAATARSLDPAQATELTRLVELEARWENLRKGPARPREPGSPVRSLLGIQSAYDAFHGTLVAYNKRYTPAHVPELLLNTPSRLAAWCGSMRQLYLRVEHDPRVACPVHLLDKAYRWAERVSVRLNKDCVGRRPPPGTIRAAIEDLEALGRWCDDLARAGGES